MQLVPVSNMSKARFSVFEDTGECCLTSQQSYPKSDMGLFIIGLTHWC